jgi:subtilisin family serine protease
VSESNSSTAEPQKRSGNALAIFLLVALPMPFCLFVYHVVLWFAEQIAITSLSAKGIAWAGPIGLALQGFVMAGFSVLLWRYTTDDRFKPVYAVLSGAALIAFPALLLRAPGPNNDQVGSILQFVIAIVAAFVVIRVRKQIEWDRGALPFGLLIAGLGIAPLAIYGSFGSLGDVFLNLLAGLAFGFLAATLMPPTTGHVLLDGVGTGAVLALLASALGYDGSQLLLLLLVPAFSFAIAALLPSSAAAAAAAGLLAFAALAFFDPTELTILLGDILGVAQKAIGSALLIGWGTSIIALILRSTAAKSAGARTKRAVGWAGTGVTWMFVIALFLLFGNPGNYSDRLFVILKDQADISDLAEIEDREQRLSAAYEGLTEHANTTQAGLRELFDKVGIGYTPYYLENAIEVRGGTLVRLFLLTRPEVDRVIPSPRLRAAPPDDPSPGPESAPGPSYTGWNIKMIGADKVWNEFDVRGQGIVVGQSDSGVDGDHPALREQYRGFNQGDDYNWFDPWDSTSSPNDEGGHGTHTMGTILGADGIGVAPEAQWIGCVNLDRNLGNPALYLDCMQFMLAPFPHGGDPFDDGDPTRAVHVMNNSWGCPSIEGCDASALKDAADNLRYAGIFVVVSTGNDGPSCETVASPLSLYDSVFSVAAIDQFGDMAQFSSRGPVTADDSGRMKPDITAPGVDILSSMPEGTYGSNSGTSMAGPHLAGVVALIWSAQPDLIGDIDATEQLIIDTAQPYNGDRSVGCFDGNEPNVAYGYGIVDVYEAVKKALEEQ